MARMVRLHASAISSSGNQICTPLFQKVHFRRYKVTSADTEGFYDGMVQRTVLVEHLSGLFHGTDIVISKNLLRYAAYNEGWCVLWKHSFQ